MFKVVVEEDLASVVHSTGPLLECLPDVGLSLVALSAGHHQ
jgi:hypothetical protein